MGGRGVDVHKVAHWRLPGAFAGAWASEELGSSLSKASAKRNEAKRLETSVSVSIQHGVSEAG